MGFKKGIVPIFIVLALLLIGTVGVTFAERSYRGRPFSKLKPSSTPVPNNCSPNNPAPTGYIQGAPKSDVKQGGYTYPVINSTNNGQFTFTAKNVCGAGGAGVDNVRYFLLNPTLAPGNSWGNPDWCSGVTPCTQQTRAVYITYDLGQSSNPADEYKLVWNGSTRSSGSTQYDRALKPGNILPGYYRVGLRVEDVNGRVTGLATSVSILITKSSNSPVPIPSSTPTAPPDLNRDSDGDGFKDSLEVYLGTNANLACGVNAWPPDFDNSRQVDISDVVAVVQKVGTSQSRYDLNRDGKVDTADVGIVQKTYYYKTCQ